jgi:AcrR family transcriptional regulator
MSEIDESIPHPGQFLPHVNLEQVSCMNKKPLNRHQRRRLRTRHQLQQAMLELVLEKGYDSLSIQNITDHADLGRGTFYIHYKDKEDLLWSMIQDRILATERAAEAGFDGAMPQQAEYYFYVNVFNHVAQNQDLYRVVLGKKGYAEMANRVRAYMVADMVKDIERYAVFTDIGQPAEITAQIVVGATISLAVWWLETPNEYMPKQIADMLYETLHHQNPPNPGKINQVNRPNQMQGA